MTPRLERLEAALAPLPRVSLGVWPTPLVPLRRLGEALGIAVLHGVYAGVAGPSYETPAEIRYLRTIGADAAVPAATMTATAAHVRRAVRWMLVLMQASGGRIIRRGPAQILRVTLGQGRRSDELRAGSAQQ